MFANSKKVTTFASAIEREILDKKDGPFVYRLGRKIFILERGVRFPHGLPNKKAIDKSMAFLFGSPALCRVCRYKESVIILGGLIFANSPLCIDLCNPYRKNLLSTTPRNEALNALIFALKASAAAFVLLFTK